MNEDSNPNDSRDAASLRILGIFFFVMGVLVLIGTFWTLENPRGTVVNIGGGLLLCAVGIAARRIARRMKG